VVVAPGGPGTSARTAVVWEVLTAAIAEASTRRGGAPLQVVDAGGGTGGFAVPLAEAGCSVTVIDPSPDSLAALSRRADERGIADLVRGVQGDLEDLSSVVDAGTADLVLCHSVLQVVDDADAALRSVAAVLRPGGRLSLLVGNRNAVVLARALAGRPDEAAHALTDPAGRWGDGDGVPRRWTPEDLVALVTGAGLHVEQLHGVRVVADLIPSAALDLEPGAPAALLALERSLADRSPFRDLATSLHVLAVRG
jgi:S-adenosylmethionine-dependent methyltransferase